MQHRFLLTSLLAASLLTPTFALAQDPAPPASVEAPESPEDIAKARAAGDAIIAEARATDLFANETKSAKAIEVRHTASGLKCRFTPGSENKIIVITQLLPRGEDIACDALMGRATFTWYATRIPGRPTAASELRGATAAIKARWPGARPWTPSGATKALLSSDKAKAAAEGTATAWFRVVDGGQPMITRASVVVVDGWVIKLRMTAPEFDARIVELLSDVFWLAAVMDAREFKAATPQAPPASGQGGS